MEFSSPPKDVVVNNDRLELMILNTDKDHRGIYRCIAHNVIGEDSYDVNLVVQYPPKLLNANKYNGQPQEVKVGEKVNLSCEAVGIPPPIIVWIKDGRPLVSTDQISLSNATELVIDKASAHHSGTYTCNITSSLGSTYRNFTLVVYESPTISSDNGTTREYLEGQLVELPCRARGLPVPIVEWTQNGVPIGRQKYVDEYGLRFVANLTDFGEYVCTAKNKYGTSKAAYTLHIWVPPYILPTSEPKQDALVGSNHTLQCDVIGFPLPTVQWVFNENLLKENTSNVRFNDIGKIDIINVTAEHEGVYACVAENHAGVADQPIYLKVNEPPTILKDNYTGTYIATNVDTILSIACRATGRPEPYIMWSKDDFYLNRDPRYTIDSDGTLHINSPSEDMSGNYTCKAKNSVGEANKIVQVEIYALPVPTQSDESLSTVNLVEGRDAVIECPVRASSHSLK